MFIYYSTLTSVLNGVGILVGDGRTKTLKTQTGGLYKVNQLHIKRGWPYKNPKNGNGRGPFNTEVRVCDNHMINLYTDNL